MEEISEILFFVSLLFKRSYLPLLGANSCFSYSILDNSLVLKTNWLFLESIIEK